MPSLQYTRHDRRILISASADMAQTIITAGGQSERQGLPLTTLTDAEAGNFTGLKAALNITPSAVPGWGLTIERTIVEVRDRRWAAIPFESFEPGALLVRKSPVHCRILQVPLAFPVRILETGSPTVVTGALEGTFSGAYRGHALIDAQTTLFAADAFTKESGWATVEILHVHDLFAGTSLLSASRADEPGTVGWFLRFSSAFQTRLIIIETDNKDKTRVRIAAQSMIDRGGPAVWLFDRSGINWGEVYGYLAHDRPLDWIRRFVGGELFAAEGAEEGLRYSRTGESLAKPEVVTAVVSGVRQQIPSRPKLPRRIPKRHEMGAIILDTVHTMRIPVEGETIRHFNLYGTRASRLGDAISAQLTRKGLAISGLDTHLTDMRNRGLDISISGITHHVRQNARPFARIDREAATNIFSMKLGQIRDMMPIYTFEDHESEGMLPLVQKIMDARAAADLLRSGRKPQQAPHRRRYVTTSFFKTKGTDHLEQISQIGARLVAEEPVHFGLQIGPKDTKIVSLGSTAFIDEQIRWAGDGAWIEAGVTPIDFDLDGDPVQELWLPRSGPSDLVTFAVRPKKNTTVQGVARLRVAIYHRNNILQSFLVAALLDYASGDTVTALARALNAMPVTVRRLGGPGYLSRVEYSIAPIEDVDSIPARDLTIVANDSAGEKVVTIKGEDLFSVRIDPTLPDKVTAARAALDQASRRGAVYRYTFKQLPNNGDPDELFDLMWDIAETGFDIFNLLVRDPEDQSRIRQLLGKAGGIHAAHIDASNVIPWSVVYDRPVIKVAEISEDASNPNAAKYKVAAALCPLSMPDLNGAIPDVQCGAAGCLLNAADNQRRKQAGQPIYLEETVICPRRFWGFMVPIEVPANQVTGLQSTTPLRLSTAIRADRPATVVGGFNPNLEFATKHADALENEVFQTLKEEVKTRHAELVTPAQSGREPLRQLLLQRDPDIVYFFCHALASLEKGGKKIGPSLDFGRGYEGVLEDVLVPREFTGKAWTHAPLVFINGCSTAGFSPYAPSEFIKQFIQGRRAAAVIGTEVTVWEMLATEVAMWFLREFLDHKSAGEALLIARRALLAKNNPLGLVYTLYGSADLALQQSPN